MKVDEVGYYWYQPKGSLFPEIVQVNTGHGFFKGQLVVWFFGNEVEITLSSAEKEGTFKEKIEYAK
jgi:hypothetical protein